MLGKLRRSSRVTLVLLGVASAASVAGCTRTQDRQDVYKSREDCLADWGNKPEDCKPATQPGHAASGFWYGPMYGSRLGFFGGGSGWSSSGGAHSIGGSSSAGGSSVSRGGFGSTGHLSGGG